MLRRWKTGSIAERNKLNAYCAPLWKELSRYCLMEYLQGHTRNRNDVEVIHNNLTDTLKSRSWKLKHSSGCESSAIERDGCSQLAVVMTYIYHFPEILHCTMLSNNNHRWYKQYLRQPSEVDFRIAVYFT